MTTIRHAAAKSFSRLAFRSLAAFCAGVLLLALQSRVTAFAQAAPSGSPAPAPQRGVINLSNSWRFQEGPPPRWAAPAYDDKDWATVDLGRTLDEQGVISYTG